MIATVNLVADNPLAGDLIVSSGGCRKVRVAGRGKGKSGGYRVVTYFVHEGAPVFLLAALSKGSEANFSAAQVAAMKQATGRDSRGWKTEVKMGVSDKDFGAVMSGLAEAADFMTGRADRAAFRVHVPSEVDVRAIRRRLGLSQPGFAARFGFSVGAVRDWEQGRKRPEASARVLLTVIDREPESVLRALADA